MPLDNTAKLSDIITALQTMEGINAKADLASVVGSPATADDTIATINSVIQGAKNTLAEKMDDGSSGAEPLKTLVDRLTMGKKWASGVATSGASNIYFKESSGTNRYASPLTVTGLNFRPTTVLAFQTDGVIASSVSVAEGIPKDSDGYHRAIINVSNIQFRVDGEVLRLINGEFNVPVNGDNTQFHWIAFE